MTTLGPGVRVYVKPFEPGRRNSGDDVVGYGVIERDGNRFYERHEGKPPLVQAWIVHMPHHGRFNVAEPLLVPIDDGDPDATTVDEREEAEI